MDSLLAVPEIIRMRQEYDKATQDEKIHYAGISGIEDRKYFLVQVFGLGKRPGRVMAHHSERGETASKL
jgi:hypothetical protein